MYEDNEPTITVNVDTTELSEKINDLKDDETVKRDKLLLDLMIHVYDEEVDRNELVDNKNCQMIVLTGVMLTLQATLFTEVLVNHIILNNGILFSFKLLTSLTIVISVILYLYSLNIFINTYAFLPNKFSMCPDNQYLLDKAVNDESEFNAQGEILATMSDAIEDNFQVIQSKVDKGIDGFVWLKRAVFSTLIVIILFLFALI